MVYVGLHGFYSIQVHHEYYFIDDGLCFLFSLILLSKRRSEDFSLHVP